MNETPTTEQRVTRIEENWDAYLDVFEGLKRDLAAVKFVQKALGRENEEVLEKLERLEKNTASHKPWFKMKGVVGPLSSGAATVGLVVGYVLNWPGEALAALAAVAGGGDVVGVIGRLIRERYGIEIAPQAPKPSSPSSGIGRIALAPIVLFGLAIGSALPSGTAQAMSRVYEVTTTTTDAAGNTVTTTEHLTKKVLEARERSRALQAVADAQKHRYEALGQALPPKVNDVTLLSAPAQLAYMEWGRSAGLVASNLAMAEALDPETTSPLQVAKEIEMAQINKGLNWARVILGTPGGAVLIDRGFDFLQGVDPGAGDWGEGAIVFNGIGHNVKDGGNDGGGGSGGESSAAGSGLAEAGVNESPINITVNNRGVNNQAWESTSSPINEFVPQGFNRPAVAEGAGFNPSIEDSHGLNLKSAGF